MPRVRILRVTGPLVFDPDFDTKHPQAKYARKIQIQTPFDFDPDSCFFLSMPAFALVWGTHVTFKTPSYDYRGVKRNWWWVEVPCEYEWIHFDRLPTFSYLRTAAIVSSLFKTSPLLVVRRMSEPNSEVLKALFTKKQLETSVGSVMWLLDAFVWTSLVVDGDHAVGRRVLACLTS